MSTEAEPETATEATLCQVNDPPATTGAVGTVWSSRTVACTQAERLPTTSTERNSTSVSPSAETGTEAPAAGDDQVKPPSVEVANS